LMCIQIQRSNADYTTDDGMRPTKFPNDKW
jgi:hypothetical protein